MIARQGWPTELPRFAQHALTLGLAPRNARTILAVWVHGTAIIRAAIAKSVLLAAAWLLAAPQASAAEARNVLVLSSNNRLVPSEGVWVRPDGGYTIAIRSVAPDGQLEAMYFNPRRLPFAKTHAALDGPALRASFDLQAGEYAGSTYDLAYNAEADRLKGIYYQAVAR